jgi:hypothetical protein
MRKLEHFAERVVILSGEYTDATRFRGRTVLKNQNG